MGLGLVFFLPSRPRHQFVAAVPTGCFFFFFSPHSNFTILLPHAPLLLPANPPQPTQFIPVYVLGVLGGSYPRTPPPPPPPPPGPAGRPPSTAPSPGPPASSHGAGGPPACCRGARPSRRRGGSTPSASLRGTGAVTQTHPHPDPRCAPSAAPPKALNPHPKFYPNCDKIPFVFDFKFSPPNFTTECLQRAAPHQRQREGTSRGHEHLPVLPSRFALSASFLRGGFVCSFWFCFFFSVQPGRAQPWGSVQLAPLVGGDQKDQLKTKPRGQSSSGRGGRVLVLEFKKISGSWQQTATPSRAINPHVPDSGVGEVFNLLLAFWQC